MKISQKVLGGGATFFDHTVDTRTVFSQSYRKQRVGSVGKYLDGERSQPSMSRVDRVGRGIHGPSLRSGKLSYGCGQR